MTGDDFATRVDQGGGNKAEARNARGQLLELSWGVLAGVPRIGLQAVGVEFLYPKLWTLPGWCWLRRSRHGEFIRFSSMKYREIGDLTGKDQRGAGPVVRLAGRANLRFCGERFRLFAVEALAGRRILTTGPLNGSRLHTTKRGGGGSAEPVARASDGCKVSWEIARIPCSRSTSFRDP